MATDERELLEAAGRWLREERERRGFPTAGKLARAIDADPSLVSRIENGASKATDERAAKIAQALGMDEVEVRRHLGLWVPDDLSRDDLESSSDNVLNLLQRLNEQVARFQQQIDDVAEQVAANAGRQEPPAPQVSGDGAGEGGRRSRSRRSA